MRLRGVRLPHKKNTEGCEPVRLPVPKTVTIPMSMHIGKDARVLVKKGDSVKVGQRIGEADGFISSHIHSSVSGTVTSVDEMMMPQGKKVSCVVISTDGKQEKCEDLKLPEAEDFDGFVRAVKDSGAVGLGGAGFPSFVKLNVHDLSLVDTVVINAAECEPYITSDTRTMLDKGEYILKGIDLIKKFMGVPNYVIVIENNKKSAILKMQKLTADRKDVRVHVLPAMYPQGGEKILIYNTLGRVVPKGGLPLDTGVIVINVTTLAFVAEYFSTGMPLVEKCVTVEGSALKEPKNVIAPIGMSLRDLAGASGGLRCTPSKVLYGGPMMGIAVSSLDEPVLKNTNAVIYMDEKEAAVPKPTACISCAACARHCPMRLDPRAIARAFVINDGAALERLEVDLCMECGCCSYICPAHRPLVQTNILSKRLLKEYQFKKQVQKEDKVKEKAVRTYQKTQKKEEEK